MVLQLFLIYQGTTSLSTGGDLHHLELLLLAEGLQKLVPLHEEQCIQEHVNY